MSTAASPAMTAAPSAPSSAPAPSTPAASSAPSAPSGAKPAASPSPTAAPGSGGGDPGAKALQQQNQPAGDAAKQQQAAAAAEAARKEEIRKHKLKVNGREMELEEGEVIRRAQLAEAADQKFREASQIRKQAEALVQALRDNPLGVLQQLGIDVRKTAESHLAAELQREMMTPEQRELHELREFRKQQEAAAENAKKTAAQRAQQEHFAKLQEAKAKEYDTQISDVLSKSNLPKTPGTVKRVAELMYNALEKGYEIDAQTAVDMVRANYTTDIESLFGSLSGEALVKALGPKLVKEIRQYDLARIKAKLNPAAPEGAQSAPATAPRQQSNDRAKHLSPDEWKAELRRKAGVE